MSAVTYFVWKDVDIEFTRLGCCRKIKMFHRYGLMADFFFVLLAPLIQTQKVINSYTNIY